MTWRMIALVVGVVPALQTTHRDPGDLVRGAGATLGQVFRGERLRAVLIVAEVALSVILLAGAGLLVRSYINLQRVDLGFRADDLMFARIRLPEERYQSAAARQQLFDDVIARLQRLPGGRRRRKPVPPRWWLPQRNRCGGTPA
jgi:putative ABC transport system permease protein